VTKLGEHVKWCSIDDVIFILDILTGEYHGLGPDQTRLWSVLFSKEGSGPANIGHSVPWEDRDALVSSLQAKGWLEEGSKLLRKPGITLRLSPSIDAFYCLMRTALTLRSSSFHAAYSWAKQCSAAPLLGQRQAMTAFQLEAAMEHFHCAERFWISRGAARDCLPRSLALFAYLRRCGLPAKHVIGVKRFPFAAHAWVEVEAKPLLAARQHGATLNTVTTVDGELESEFVPIAELE